MPIEMMIELKAIIYFWPWILALAVITFVGQTCIGTADLFLRGKKSETAFKAAFRRHTSENLVLSLPFWGILWACITRILCP
jgi:hypothetical protein